MYVFTFKTVYLFTALVICDKMKIVEVQGTLNAHSLQSTTVDRT